MSQVETQNWSQDHIADELSEYNSVSRLAVIAILLGIASPLAWLGPYLWWIPVVAVCVSIAGLIHVNRPQLGLIGRKAAIGGLCLALISGIGAPTQHYTYRYLVQLEGKRFALQWFDYLRKGEVEKAHQMTVAITDRQPLNEDLWEFYRERSDWADDLREYANTPVVRTLLALGDRANVRLYDRHGVVVQPRTDGTIDQFAVTYEDEGVKKSFFLYVFLKRHYNSFAQRGQWKIDEIQVRKNIEPTGAEEDDEGKKDVLPARD